MLPGQHPLSIEYPEMDDAIDALKMRSANFVRMFDGYHLSELAILRAEAGIDQPGEAALTEMKKHRIQLKDHLYRLLKAEQLVPAQA